VPGILKEFREFISRGNVVELAVAVIIGAAFTKIVTAVVEGLITPLVGMVGGKDFRQMSFEINESVFRYGLVINAVIYFVAVAAVVFFLIVKPINVLNERRRRGEEPVEEAELSDEVVLLAEIRDLLAARSGAAGAPPDGPGEPPSTTGW
jgi:large conductance mechanosensitive channel